jgi:hypothetical protein
MSSGVVCALPSRYYPPRVNWGVITANAIAALAAVVAYVGVRQADKRAQRAERQAQDADALAGRAAEAADRSASAMERMAVAMEQRAINDERHAPTASAAWQLEHYQRDAYLLSNAGRGTAYDVRVEPGDHMFTDNLPDGATIAPGGAARFLAGSSLATRDDTMTVTWSNHPGGERLAWTRPLPPRPIPENISSMSTGEQIRELMRFNSRPDSSR